MDKEIEDDINSLEELLENIPCRTAKEKQLINSLIKTTKAMKKHYGQIYVDKLADVRNAEAEAKVVTSVAIHEDNQKFIEELQLEAKEHYFHLSKENIINLALCCLKDKYISSGDVESLIDCFF